LLEFSQTYPKIFCATSTCEFSRTKVKTFFGVTWKKGLHVFFCKGSAPFFEVQQCWAPILTLIQRSCQIFAGFGQIQDFCPDFRQIKLSGVRLHPLPPALQIAIIFCTIAAKFANFSLLLELLNV